MISTTVVDTYLELAGSAEVKLHTSSFRVIDESLLKGACYLDLNEGYNEHRVDRERAGIDVLWRAIIRRSPEGNIVKAVENAQIVARRGLLTDIAMAKFLGIKGDVSFACEKRGGVIFVNACKEREIDRNMLGRPLYWGNRFEEYVVSSPSTEVEKEKFEENFYNKFTTFTRFLVKADLTDKHGYDPIRLFYSGEIDAVDENKNYVQIKTRRVDRINHPFMVSNYLRWWLQNRLTGVKKLFVGNRDLEGIVRKCETVEVADLPKYLGGAHNRCLEFLHYILNGLVQNLKDGDSGSIHIRKGEPHHEPLNTSILSDEFKQHFNL